MTRPRRFPVKSVSDRRRPPVTPEATPGAVHWAEIAAARNEFESFQVHVRADGVGVDGA